MRGRARVCVHVSKLLLDLSMGHEWWTTAWSTHCSLCYSVHFSIASLKAFELLNWLHPVWYIQPSYRDYIYIVCPHYNSTLYWRFAAISWLCWYKHINILINIQSLTTTQQTRQWGGISPLEVLGILRTQTDTPHWGSESMTITHIIEVNVTQHPTYWPKISIKRHYGNIETVVSVKSECPNPCVKRTNRLRKTNIKCGLVYDMLCLVVKKKTRSVLLT